MESPYDAVSLARRLGQMPEWKAVALGLVTVERMIPAFATFAQRTGHSGEHILRAALDECWSQFERGRVGFEMPARAAACHDVAPDTDDYDDVLVSAALDAATAAGILCHAAGDALFSSILDIPALAHDTADLLAQEQASMAPNTPNLEDLILRHPFVQAELSRQRGDVEFLEGLDDNISLGLPHVLERWRNSREPAFNLHSVT